MEPTNTQMERARKEAAENFELEVELSRQAQREADVEARVEELILEKKARA